MAIIATNVQQAKVQAQGEAMAASVNFSGALMEMLATVYVYIMLAGIREAVQNACDAARRSGLSFSEGVLVKLPTASNPVITIIDKGAGMTKEFMETTYLSFGSSTKNEDNGSAGGLGVGRWAAYGYIRECFIQTCSAEDMVSRTYFQFQGAKNTPQVQLASEVAGTETGTTVFFPIKETDLDEALRAVAWLKEVMQLTMGDSFSVDKPHLLPSLLPEFSGTVLDLGSVDSSLVGVRVYPMKGSALKYSRQGLQEGSLVVLTNQEAGVGGLPFHVQSPGGFSVYDSGMVIEIPMSYNIPFMPSREELKYTDEVNALLARIHRATEAALLQEVSRLVKAETLSAMRLVEGLLGNGSAIWHCFSKNINNDVSLAKTLRAALGVSNWNGKVKVKSTHLTRSTALTIRYGFAHKKVTSNVGVSVGDLVYTGDKGLTYPVQFPLDVPLVLVQNDLVTGGYQRFRNWFTESHLPGGVLYVSGESAEIAADAVQAINTQFGGELPVVLTSKLPAPARVVRGSKVEGAATKGQVVYFCVKSHKQQSTSLALHQPDAAEPVRVWLEKEGGALSGLSSSVALSNLTSCFGVSVVELVLKKLGAKRLYLLTKKQVRGMQQMAKTLTEDGFWDACAEDFQPVEDYPAEHDSLQQVKGLKAWISFEEAIRRVLALPDVKEACSGEKPLTVTASWALTRMCAALASEPRMVLTGTPFDKAMAPVIDLLACRVLLHTPTDADVELYQLFSHLATYGKAMLLDAGDPEDRKDLKEFLVSLEGVGHVNYEAFHAELLQRFPLLRTLSWNADKEAVRHACVALASVYR